jgi:hypothetical protein
MNNTCGEKSKRTYKNDTRTNLWQYTSQAETYPPSKYPAAARFGSNSASRLVHKDSSKFDNVDNINSRAICKDHCQVQVVSRDRPQACLLRKGNVSKRVGVNVLAFPH